MKNVVLKVEGMTWGHCKSSVEDAVKKLGAKGKVDLQAKTVAIEFDESKISLESIKEAIEDQGYDVVA